MTLSLYNTLTRKKAPFDPIDWHKGSGIAESDRSVRMYVCGPTVYDYAHIGNARPVIVFDVLFRLLRSLYGDAHVKYVRNITDVDDKINARALEEGIDIRDLTERTNEQFQADIAALNCLPPSVQPRATEHINEMIKLIEALIERGHAYVAEGHALFHVPSMASYGSLSNRSVEEMQAGARVEVAPYKKDPMDFVLWKPSRDEEPGWESPFSKSGERGRPGWHIECSAMSSAHLGEVFDIHGGGIDLVFPHHENEIAQSCSAHGTDKMANVWMHNGFLQVEGEKMSKSLGNFVTVREVLNDWPGEVARFAMLSTHYRQPINWTLKTLTESQKVLDGWQKATEGEIVQDDQVNSEFLEALSDDLNTPKAISILHQLRSGAKKGDELARTELKASAIFIGLLELSSAEWDALTRVEVDITQPMIEKAIKARLEARDNKDWAEADRIRDELLEKGIVLKDGPEGTTFEVKR